MTHGLLPEVVEVAEDADTGTGRAGLPLGLETLRALGLERVIAAHVQVRERASGATEVETVEALVLLLAAGGDCLDDIAGLPAAAGLGRLWGRTLPAADTLRHFLSAFHDDQLIARAQAQRPPGTVADIPAETGALSRGWGGSPGPWGTGGRRRARAPGPRWITMARSKRATSARPTRTPKAGGGISPRRSIGWRRTSGWPMRTATGTCRRGWTSCA